MEDQAANIERGGNLGFSEPAERSRSLERSERRYFEAFFNRIRRNHWLAAYVVLPVVFLSLAGLLTYSFVQDGFGVGGALIFIFAFLAMAPISWMIAKRTSETKVEKGKALRPLRGTLGPRLRGTGTPGGLAIGNHRVSAPSLWPVIWQSEVEALVYETNSGQRLIVELEYLEDEIAQAAVEQYESETGRRPSAGNRFVLADDVEAGTAKLEKNYYGFY